MHFVQLHGDSFIIVILGKYVLVMNKSTGESKRLLTSSASTGVIVASSVYENGLYLCCAYSDKTVTCWDLSNDGVVEHNYRAAKKPTAIACTKYGNNAALLVSDKFGDVYATDLPAMRKQVKLLGHTASVITDMVMLPDAIISADRDEKIRITKYPQTCVVSAYCLAHTDVVSSLCLSGDLFLSAGLDHRICAWKCNDFSKVSECILDTLPVRDETIANDEEVGDEGEAEEEEEIAEDDGRVDAAAAGTFPCRVTALAQLNLAVVMLRNSNRVKILSTTNGILQDTGVTIELAAVPIHCTVHSDNQVLFLLPMPHYVVCYNIVRDESGAVEVRITNTNDAWNSSIASAVQEKDIELQQRVSFVDETNPTAAPYSGM